MARQLNRLSARKAMTITKPGRHADGGGLYLVVGPGASRRWVFLFRWEGKLTEMGLAVCRPCTLADARSKAAEARRLLAERRNPLLEKRSEQARSRAAQRRSVRSPISLSPTSAMASATKSTSAQWATTLKTYAAPLRDIGLDDITTEDVLAVLKPIWHDEE